MVSMLQSFRRVGCLSFRSRYTHYQTNEAISSQFAEPDDMNLYVQSVDAAQGGSGRDKDPDYATYEKYVYATKPPMEAVYDPGSDDDSDGS